MELANLRPRQSARLNPNATGDASEIVMLNFSLTPGFSRVLKAHEHRNRFNGFPRLEKPLKRLKRPGRLVTWLKSGVNESCARSVSPREANRTAIA
jgi:hypothetical protein